MDRLWIGVERSWKSRARGAFAAGRLPEQYYGQYIRAAQQGGMAAVCDTEQYRERIAANPKNRDVLMAMDPKRYIAVMEHWLKLFQAGANYTICSGCVSGTAGTILMARGYL